MKCEIIADIQMQKQDAVMPMRACIIFYITIF